MCRRQCVRIVSWVNPNLRATALWLSPLANIVEISHRRRSRQTTQRGPAGARGRIFPFFPGKLTSSDGPATGGSWGGPVTESDKFSSHFTALVTLYSHAARLTIPHFSLISFLWRKIEAKNGHAEAEMPARRRDSRDITFTQENGRTQNERH
jgi:hypothetical protein